MSRGNGASYWLEHAGQAGAVLAISLDVFAEPVDEGESAKPRKTTPPAGKGKGEAKAGKSKGKGGE